jgi:hypothetical protein
MLIYINRKDSIIHEQTLSFDYRFLSLVAIVGILSFVFITKLELPLFTDSIHHYAYIDGLSRTNLSYSGLFGGFPFRFYHYGFHLFVAQAHYLTGIPISDLMLASGVHILMLCAVGIFVIGLSSTESIDLALITACIIALTGVFPSFALNWGKYPALFSMALLQFPLSIMIRSLKHGSHVLRSQETTLVGISTIVAGMAHWRSILVIVAAGLVCCYCLLARKYDKLKMMNAIVSLVITFLAIIELTKLNIPIANKGLWIIILSGSIVFCLRLTKRGINSQIVMPLLLFGLIFAATKITMPLRWIQFASLIDWPYYRISLFIPATVLLAVSLSEMECFSFAQSRKQHLFWTVMLISLILLPWKQRLVPGQQFILVGRDQMQAFNWIEQTYSNTEAKFLISGIGALDYYEATDSGGWIEPLTGIETEVLPVMIDFTSVPQRDLLCATKPLIYIDHNNRLSSYNDFTLDTKLYHTLYNQGSVRIITPRCK